MPRPRLRRALRRTGVLLLGLLLAWGVGELVLLPVEAVRPNPRYAPGQRPNDLAGETFLAVDEALGWSMVPDISFVHATGEFTVTYHSDAAGIRIPGGEPAPDRARTVVLLGDSFTFGIGVEYEDTYGARIERALGDARLHNLALPGYGVDQMWLQLAERGLALEPDVVIVGLCDADFGRSLSGYYRGNGLNKPAFKLVDGALERRTARDGLNPLVQLLDERSRVWMAFRQLVRKLDYSRPTSAWWHLNEALLDRMRATCRDREIELVFVYVPTPEWRPFPTLASYMQRVGARYVDLTDGAPAERGELHFPVDRHFTPQGHAYAAERILERLARE